MQIFYRAPAGFDNGKGDRKTGKKKGRERGIWDLCMILSAAHRPPPFTTSPPILRVLPHLPAAEVQWEGPSPLATHNPFQQLEAIALDL